MQTPRNDQAATDLTRQGLAILHLGLRSASELTDLVAETHATIAATPLPWNKDASQPAHAAPFAYKLVTRAFLHVARLAQQWLGSGSIPALQQGQLAYSALNGVCGDKLHRWNSPLAQRMMFCDETGQELKSNWHADAQGAVVFIHGLCLSEREWQTRAQERFVAELRASGHAVAWLRYNTGRAIADNGQELHGLLESLHTQTNLPPLTLIGHSMGGLVIRAASHVASEQGAGWVGALRQAAYVGSPHLGAPLEKIGNALNNTLGVTPYTKPFMRLGNIRSQGIRDLRHGRVNGNEHNPELLASARHLLLAGNISIETDRHWLGDGLVPVASALGEAEQEARRLTAPDLTRRAFKGMGHMAMLEDARIYATIGKWMRDRA